MVSTISVAANQFDYAEKIGNPAYVWETFSLNQVFNNVTMKATQLDRKKKLGYQIHANILSKIHVYLHYVSPSSSLSQRYLAPYI